MEKIKTNEWIPAAGLSLEDNAMRVVKSSKHNLVVAGPGAGKTELLAQRACYLLQTNTCEFPYKILAISFKRDAAYNLRERVKERVGEELSNRFESVTFDSFAKQLLDRFRSGLPEAYYVSSQYRIITGRDQFREEYRGVDEDFYHQNMRNLEAIHTYKELGVPLDTKEDEVVSMVWERMLSKSPSWVTFPMITRLAEAVIKFNPKLQEFLQETYRYIFLDEFQDTTTLQYNFFKTCFLGSECVFTAVGDDKQRIMTWAGALETIFTDFEQDTGADLIPLVMNFRSAPRLVKLQNYLSSKLLGETVKAIPSNSWHEDDGECFVWIFEDTQEEKEVLFRTVDKYIAEGEDPREICVLVKQRLDVYVGDLIAYFNSNGILARDENKYQNLLAENHIQFIIHFLYWIFDKKALESKSNVLRFFRSLENELTDDRHKKLEARVFQFTKKMRRNHSLETISAEPLIDLVNEMVSFADKDKILMSSILSLHEIDGQVENLISEMVKELEKSGELITALDFVVGKDTVPVMTIHKSKGLEYNTVIFVGLEDRAFWTFRRQEEEDKRAFFVALTRAKKRVIFTFSKKRADHDGRLQNQRAKNIQILVKELRGSGLVEIKKRRSPGL